VVPAAGDSCEPTVLATKSAPPSTPTARRVISGAVLVMPPTRIPQRAGSVAPTTFPWVAGTSDEALVHAVYSEHGRAMLAYATRLLGERAAAEDVVQEALVRAWRNPQVLTNGKGSTRGWLLTVVRNLVIDRMRAKQARPMEVAESPDQPAVERDHADSVATAVTVRAAMDTLSDDHRGVLEQLYFQGRSMGEAAAALGVPPGTVKSRSYYALRALRRAIDQSEGVAP
jgi:RNA polymerase sigma-70 factor, ECF subfamily